MKKMSRKPFRGGPLFSSKASSSTASHGSSNSSPSMSSSGANGVTHRTTWADKIREKLPPLGENEYEVLWERGVLGVIFLESEKDGIPYVSKATESCISSAVSQGDILTYVNVVRSKDHSFSDFFKILATMKKPVLLRFERLAASTPSSDDDEASQLFNAQRSGAGTCVNVASQFARQNLSHADEAEPTGRTRRANSVQKDQKPLQATRGAFWRAPNAKDSGSVEKHAQTIGPIGMNGTNDRMATWQPHRHGSSSKDQVSPRNLTAVNGSGGHSPLNLHEYEVYWETGSLGLFFAENRLTNLPVVTRSTASANPVVRRSVTVNDTLVSANGIKSADYSFEAFFGRLQQMSKPVRLVLRRKQPNEQVVIVKQVDSQQQRQTQHPSPPQLQQRQQKLSEQEEGHEQDQKRELLQMREQQQREQLQLRKQEHQEQQQREQQQREQHQREQKLREQQLQAQQLREEQQHEQKQREQQQREQRQREQRQREQLQREQEQREQEQRELEQRKQEQREREQREQELCEQEQREKQLHELREREQRVIEEQRRQQEIADSNSSPLASPAHGHPPRNHTPSPTVKRATTPPPRPPSPHARRESTANYRKSRHASKANRLTSPLSSPIKSRKSSLAKSISSTNHDISPKINVSPVVQGSPRVDYSPNFGCSPEVSGSPLTSPVSSFGSTNLANDMSNVASPSDDTRRDEESQFPLETEESVSLTNESNHIAEIPHGKRSRNSSEERWKHQTTTRVVHNEEPILSPAGKTTHLSPTEPWDLPEIVSTSSLLAEPVEVDEGDDIDDGVPLPLSAGSYVDHVDMADHADLAVKSESCEDEIAEEGEMVETGLFAEVSELSEDIWLAEEAELAEEDILDDEANFAEEVEPAIPLHSVVDSADNDVEIGMLADVEVGIAMEEIECEVEANDAWDFEHGSDGEKRHHPGMTGATSRDENSVSRSRRSSVDCAVRVESSKVDFADASESADEFSNDRDISSDIDVVDSDIMIRQARKDKVEVNQPRPTKSSLNANLAKYKKKGKTSRGVAKLPALKEEQALTVPLLSPNAVNTTVQVRGRPKPKSTMADTPDSTTYLVKWKENRSIGLQLKEVRLAKGTYPLIIGVCHEPCCELLRHICVGDVILEINGRNTSTMGVKKTVNFLKTCTKTTLMKIRHGPGFAIQRVSATV